MELIGRTVPLANGTTRDEFVGRCEIHDWYYRGSPPITHGCRECWHTYYFMQWAGSKGDLQANLEQLESAIRHATEAVDRGEWDFKPELEIKIENEDPKLT